MRMTTAGACLTCSTHIAPRPAHRYKGKPPLYCSRRCTGLAVRQEALGPPAAHPCRACERPIIKGAFCTPGHAKDHALAIYMTRQWYPDGARKVLTRRCGWCQKTYRPAWRTKPTSYCSARCKRMVIQAERNRQQSKRRAKERGIEADAIDWRVVGDRDEWICYLCGEWVPFGLRGTTDPMAPEVDHVLALAHGGPHAYDNVRISHRKCNEHKGDRPLQSLQPQPQGPRGSVGSLAPEMECSGNEAFCGW